MSETRLVSFIALLMLSAATPGLPARAQETPATGTAPAQGEAGAPAKRWSNSAELSYVVLSGNSDSSTLGVKNTYKWSRDNSTITVKAKAIRTESENKGDRRAVGTPTDFRVVAGEEQVTAENHKLETRYDRRLTEQVFWYGDLSWERDRFKGINNRTVGAAGIGNLWVHSKRVMFRTEYAATYTREDEVEDNPETDDTFAGARISSLLEVRFGRNSTYSNEFAFDANLEESSDWRADMTNALSVTINHRLKLKVSLQWKFDNEPSLEELDLFDAGNPVGTVNAELDELDTIFMTSLVLDF